MSMTPDEYREEKTFWLKIVYNDDGTINEDKLMPELHDYRTLLEHSVRVYHAVTGGAIDRVTYPADTVISINESVVEEMIQDAIIVALQRVKDGEDIDEVMKEYPA